MAPYDKDLEMDHEKVKTISEDVSSLADIIQSLKTFPLEEPLAKGDIGGSPLTESAITAFNEAYNRLGLSIDKLHKYLVDGADALSKSAAATKAQEIENTWHFNQMGGK